MMVHTAVEQKLTQIKRLLADIETITNAYVQPAKESWPADSIMYSITSLDKRIDEVVERCVALEEGAGDARRAIARLKQDIDAIKDDGK